MFFFLGGVGESSRCSSIVLFDGLFLVCPVVGKPMPIFIFLLIRGGVFSCFFVVAGRDSGVVVLG